MSEPTNPYQAPEQDSAPSAPDTHRDGSKPLARVIEYAIAIILIIALIAVFLAFFGLGSFRGFS